jgi:type I restriction-modification system DNA methylase subunit
MTRGSIKGDVNPYMLAKIATAGPNGQFRPPRHIIQLIVELTAPKPTHVICDAAGGTAGFWMAVGDYLAVATRTRSTTPRCASTSTIAFSTASTSTAPCCASTA